MKPKYLEKTHMCTEEICKLHKKAPGKEEILWASHWNGWRHDDLCVSTAASQQKRPGSIPQLDLGSFCVTFDWILFFPRRSGFFSQFENGQARLPSNSSDVMLNFLHCCQLLIIKSLEVTKLLYYPISMKEMFRLMKWILVPVLYFILWDHCCHTF